jgi:uncharacterized LabA/DUF88 family protein
MEEEHVMPDNRRIAMLIDGDNAQASLLEQMLAEANKYGVVTIRRVYGDWTEPQMKSWKAALHTAALQPFQQFRYTVGKNATDSAMIIDAMDILYTAGVDGFCLVSSDSDYTRLATRIREKNLFVMGIGRKNTPRSFVNGCDVFVYTENLGEAEPDPKPAPSKSRAGAASSASTNEAEESSLSVESLFETAFDQASQDNGWAQLSTVGTKLRQLDPAFDSRSFGYRTLSQLVNAKPDIFEVRRKKGSGQPIIFVRLKDAANLSGLKRK